MSALRFLVNNLRGKSCVHTWHQTVARVIDSTVEFTLTTTGSDAIESPPRNRRIRQQTKKIPAKNVSIASGGIHFRYSDFCVRLMDCLGENSVAAG